MYEKERRAVAAMVEESEILWIQLYGADVEGRNLFLERILRLLEERHQLLFEHDFSAFPLSYPGEESLFYRHFLATHSDDFSRFKRHQSPGIRGLIEAYLAPEGRTDTADIWERNIFSALVNFMAEAHPRCLVLANIPEDPSPGQLGVIRALQDVRHPLVVISTGERPLPMERLEGFQEFQVPLEKLPVRDAEHLVARYAGTSMINARLITNHIYIKSGGQTRLIRPMVDCYFRAILPDDPDALIEHARLQHIKPGSQPEMLFNSLTAFLPGPLLKLLALLSRVNDPLPMSLFVRLAREMEIPRSALGRWLKSGLLHRVTYQDLEAVTILWPEWRRYLRHQVQIEELGDLLAFLSGLLDKTELPWPVEFSPLFDLAGDSHTAIWLAQREARAFRHLEQQRRSLERYAYLRRNLKRIRDKRVSLAEILGEQGQLQFEMGLYENAFESLREFRETLSREQSAEWIRTSLTMADALIRMDAFQEARYLIQELKPKDIETPFVRAFADLLLGELEENLGHPGYAYRHFWRALESATASTPEWLIRRILDHLRHPAREGKLKQSYHDVLTQGLDTLPANSDLSLRLNLEKIREMMNVGSVMEALRLARDIFRRGGPLSHPGWAVQLHLYLAEIYGYLGKWHLSRSYLRRLLGEPLLTPPGPLRIQVEVDLAIVEKELGHYGKSLERLQNALIDVGTANEQARLRHQIFVHMGHIYLLVQGVLRARELLEGSLQWAQGHPDPELAMQAALFLTSYELQLERPDSAQRYLDIARANVEQVDVALDSLNLRYYDILLQIHRGGLERAEEEVARMSDAARGVVKFEILSLWLAGKVRMARGDYDSAQTLLKGALEAASRFRLPQVVLQTCRDLSRLATLRGDLENEALYQQAAGKAFEKVLEGVGDEILQRQMAESREYQELRHLVRVG